MEPTSADLIARQVWVDPTPTSGSLPHTCTPFRLTSGGEINIGGGIIVTLTQDAAYQPACSGTPVPPPIDPLQPGVDLSALDSQDPWYSSTNPQIYAISAVTVVSYMLLLILFITPKTYFVGGAGGGGGFLGQRGVISGAYGSNSVIGIGSRPLLQKIAALTVAVSMTIVTVDTLKWAHHQYDAGYQDSSELTIEVIDAMEVRVIRVISETFLWLAQAQTLIRLFPRRREKLLIKWIAFALVTLELVFSTVNHFVVEASARRSGHFSSAIPAMNYLFALALGVCYAGYVIYYALQRRRFAFYHPHMRNMPLFSLISLASILIPVVFFVLDLSKPNVSGWGNYVRWVGSASASVLVWEWVERMEALERDEKKGGILGREIFDSDEALDATPDSDVRWPSSQRKDGQRSDSNGAADLGRSTGWHSMTAKARGLGRYRRSRRMATWSGPDSNPSQKLDVGIIPRFFTSHPVPPPAAASPTDRLGSSSAASTVYVVRYHPTSEPTPPIREGVTSPSEDRNPASQNPEQSTDLREPVPEPTGHASVSTRQTILAGLQRIPNPFRRTRETPPPEVARALADRSLAHGANQDRNVHRPSVLELLHLKKTPNSMGHPKPVIVVPAPPRRRNSMSDASAGSGGEADTEHSAIQRQSNLSNVSIDRNASLPPNTVLDARIQSGSVSRLSEHASRRSL